MKALVEKKIEYWPNHFGKETLSDNISEFKEIVTTIYFIGIPIFCAVKKLAKLNRRNIKISLIKIVRKTKCLCYCIKVDHFNTILTDFTDCKFSCFI